MADATTVLLEDVIRLEAELARERETVATWERRFDKWQNWRLFEAGAITEARLAGEREARERLEEALAQAARLLAVASEFFDEEGMQVTASDMHQAYEKAREALSATGREDG